MIKIDTSIFKAYDIRGLSDSQLTPELAYLLGRAYAQIIKPEPKIVGVGRDVRTSGNVLFPALVRGLLDEGLEVVDLGVISTDMLYFGVGYYNLGGGITVSASHNPSEYNGFKLVRDQAQAISGETGIVEIKDRVLELNDQGVTLPLNTDVTQHVHPKEILQEDYLDYMTKFFDLPKLQAAKKMRIAFNANHGISGQVILRAIEKFNLPIEPVGLFMEPNGAFPQGRPDPLQPANQASMKKVLLDNECDFGVAWDADADRCFFFDEAGAFVDGYYTGALLSKNILLKNPGEKIIYDPRLTWAMIDTVTDSGGTPLLNKVGHSYIKARMKKENAIFASEMTGHYYFRDFWYADNGLIPFFMIYELLVTSGKKLSELVEELRSKYFISGEINLKNEDIPGTLKRIEAIYADGKIEHIDGLSVEYSDWRLNLRGSNTEPLLRLNLEAKSEALMEERRDEVLKEISGD